MSAVDRAGVLAAYEDVRDDKSETMWALFLYNDSGKKISVGATGKDFKEYLTYLKDDMRAYAFIRVETGDELSKRAKFCFVTWIGENVSPLKKAKVSTDKAEIKQIVQNFAVEVLGSDKSDVSYEVIKTKIDKAGGANYGIGK